MLEFEFDEGMNGWPLTKTKTEGLLMKTEGKNLIVIRKQKFPTFH